jgi:hypothetical protein
MGRTNRALRLLIAVLAVWCLGCDAFESIAESLLEQRAPSDVAAAATDVASVDAADACHCVLGHAAVVSAASAAERPPAVVADFVERPTGVLLPAPEPLLRPPVV